MKSETMKMDVFVPIDLQKSLDTTDTEQDLYISGIASTPSRDLQGEIVMTEGISLEYFLSSGYINYNHQQDADSMIGVPTEKCYVDSRGIHVEAKLFKDNKYVKQIIDLADNIKKSGVDRKPGFSIEGAIRKRNDIDSTIIEDVMITNISVVTHPANQDTSWDYFMKSLTTGHGTTPDTQVDGASLRRESIAQSITTLAGLNKVTDSVKAKSDFYNAVSLLEKGNQMDYETAVLTLQIAKGLSRKDAELSVLEMRKGDLNNG